METSRYTIKSLDVDAVQVTEDTIHEVAAWCGGEVKDAGTLSLDGPDGKPYIELIILGDGPYFQYQKALVWPGDWLVRTEQDTRTYFKVFPDVIFKKTCTPASEEGLFTRVLELVEELLDEDFGCRCYPGETDQGKLTARETTMKIMKVIS